MLAYRSLRAVSARLGLVASLSLAAGGVLAQDHYDSAGTRIPAFVLLDGCLSEGACAGPNGSGNPLFVTPATGMSWGVAGAPGAFADGWSVTEGAKADAANAATDATPVSAMSVWKQISKSVQAAVTALGSPMQNSGGTVSAGHTVSVCVTPTVSASNAYGANYVVGGLLDFAGAFTATGSGVLEGVSVNIKAVEASGFTFFPFAGNPSNTTWADAAVANIAAADKFLPRGPVALNANSQLGTHTNYSAAGIGEALAPGATDLRGVLIANAALTNTFVTTGDLQVCIKILQDP